MSSNPVARPGSHPPAPPTGTGLVGFVRRRFGPRYP